MSINLEPRTQAALVDLVASIEARLVNWGGERDDFMSPHMETALAEAKAIIATYRITPSLISIDEHVRLPVKP